MVSVVEASVIWFFVAAMPHSIFLDEINAKYKRKMVRAFFQLWIYSCVCACA